jgi:peptidoglycan/LPS O-acetylase OafA/YrhL
MTGGEVVAEACAEPRRRVEPLPALTGARFFAALAVVFFHHVHPSAAPPYVRSLVSRGDVAVPFFFVLSGFVLSYNYVGDERRVDRRRFWQARFARVYPTYLLSLVVALPLLRGQLLGYYHHPPDVAVQHALVIVPLTLLMLQTWWPLQEIASNWNVPAWSLGVEAAFYALFPVLALPLRRARMSALVAAVAALSVLSALVFILLVPRLPDSGALLGIRGRFWWGAQPLVHLSGFALGMVYGRIFTSSDVAARRRTYGALALVSTAASIALVAFTPDAYYHTAVLPWLSALFGVMVLSIAAGAGVLVRFLSLPFIVLLGEASYALYLLHVPLWPYLRRAWTLAPAQRLGLPDTSSALFEATYVFLSVVASVLVYLYFEGRARRRVLVAFRGRRATVPGGERAAPPLQGREPAP